MGLIRRTLKEKGEKPRKKKGKKKARTRRIRTHRVVLFSGGARTKEEGHTEEV